MASANYKVITTRKGKRGIECNTYFYNFNSRSSISLTEWWRCSNRSCGGRGKLEFKSELFQETKIHTLCFPSSANCENREVMQKVKERSVSHPFEPSGQTVASVMATIDVLSTPNLPKPSSMQRSVRRRRQKMRAMIEPKDLLNIRIPEQNSLTLSGKKFILDDTSDGILVFTTMENLMVILLTLYLSTKIYICTYTLLYYTLYLYLYLIQ
jgi:hypothetical protein